MLGGTCLFWLGGVISHLFCYKGVWIFWSQTLLLSWVSKWLIWFSVVLFETDSSKEQKSKQNLPAWFTTLCVCEIFFHTVFLDYGLSRKVYKTELHENKTKKKIRGDIISCFQPSKIRLVASDSLWILENDRLAVLLTWEKMWSFLH